MPVKMKWECAKCAMQTGTVKPPLTASVCSRVTVQVTFQFSDNLIQTSTGQVLLRSKLRASSCVQLILFFFYEAVCNRELRCSCPATWNEV